MLRCSSSERTQRVLDQFTVNETRFLARDSEPPGTSCSRSSVSASIPSGASSRNVWCSSLISCLLSHDQDQDQEVHKWNRDSGSRQGCVENLVSTHLVGGDFNLMKEGENRPWVGGSDGRLVPRSLKLNAWSLREIGVLSIFSIEYRLLTSPRPRNSPQRARREREVRSRSPNGPSFSW
jgi:hypothetical protein